MCLSADASESKLSITSLLAPTNSSQPDGSLHPKLLEIRHELLDLLSALQTAPTLDINEVGHSLDFIIRELNAIKIKKFDIIGLFESEFTELANVSFKCRALLGERELLDEYIGKFRSSALTETQPLVIDVLTQDIMSERESTKSRKKRLEKEKVKLLEAWYGGHFKKPYLTENTLSDLVENTGLSKVQIRNWVSNKRRKERTGSVSSELSLLLDPSSEDGSTETYKVDQATEET